MRLLVDTQAFLWAQTDPDRLGEHRAAVEDPKSERLVSAASSWEIAIKFTIGRLPLPEPPERYVPDRIRALKATALPVTHEHALAVASLPRVHGDPFDRLLVAQAGLLGVPILTADRVIAKYPVRTLLIG